ncbi:MULTISPECIES: FAD-dependent oxidoreductase [Kitasatospora]|uniref:Putative oxidoreductase n=1 Tax=Kitasatospora setae (strain ATCC 33774 / DSM 43861 / JCM 3304 / KCC A-0304 / NBRC 14216 / KM-6054) TaxID=452652 RepID=E4N112_KITSK|nr:MULTISPECIES: FAD-dependent oxidoreductase [Kitasatospora]BAJ31846.1 putative oxidoreductase [Kitasatospora setae KM-6054]
MTTVNGGVSFWYAATGLPGRGAPLDGDTAADVCVVGGGYTGLWTAYYLKRAAPDLDVVLLEAEFCGYGASGRNGGWLYNGIAGRGRYARLHGPDAARRLQRAMNDTVTETLRAAEAEGIDCDAHRGGVLEVATTPAQLARLRARVAHEQDFGAAETHLLDAAQTAERLYVPGALGAGWSPHGARIHPARLVLGLAAAVRRLGVRVYESTPATALAPGRATTPHGTVSARVVLRCTEGFTADVAGQHRSWLPMNSSMIATEPLPAEFWEAVGWHGREVLGDEAHAYMYAQRTADDRIALGGRGHPYRYGSRIDRDGATPAGTVDQLRAILARMFPAAADARIDHAWSGVLGVPRDWCAAVDLDPATGLGFAGGYVGSGVATTNLAGRTLRDLTLHHLRRAAPTDLTTLPWVGHRVRRWEPEPLRWLGVHALYAVYRHADRREHATTSPLATLADRISGRG